MDDELLEQRFDLLSDVLEHVDVRISALESARDSSLERKEARHGRTVNFAMLGLFVLEVAIGLIEIWMMHHV
jgi:hypothetical protein